MAHKTVFIQNEQEVIDYYNLCKSLDKLSEKFGYKKSTLYRFLKDSGVSTKLDVIKLRQSVTKYPIDNNYFENIDTRDKAYIFGIISSDGHLLKNSKQIRIKLTDIDLLHEINIRLKYNKPLLANKKYLPSHKKSKTIIICNEKIYDDLILLGVPQQKSYNNAFPNLDHYLLRDFIRGFFDGNGCIWGYKTKSNFRQLGIEIVSTHLFCNQLKNILSGKGINSVITNDKRHDNRIRSLKIKNLEGIIRFYYFIYGDIEGQIYLDRKYKKYSIFINERKNHTENCHYQYKKFSSFNINIA